MGLISNALFAQSSPEITDSTDTNIFIHFSEPMDRISTEMAFEMTNLENGNIINGSFHWNKNLTVIKFDPASSLANNIQYEIKIFEDARDRAGMTIDLNMCKGVNFCLYTCILGIQIHKRDFHRINLHTVDLQPD